MGNHEFCTECGASDFHYGQPCEPERFAKYQKEQEEAEQYTLRAEEAAKQLCKRLKAQGIPAKIGNYGHVLIEKWSLL